MEIQRNHYGAVTDGTKVDSITVTNSSGMRITVLTYGAILNSVQIPRPEGQPLEVTLGFESLDGYLSDQPFFGATVGRFANRIANGRFTLDGHEYILERNEKGVSHLHGGVQGFDKRVWEVFPFKNEKAGGVKCVLTSPDGDEGYPGTLEVRCTYTIYESDNAFDIEFDADTDAPTPLNLTNHTYWNLAGEGNGDILDHELRINASTFLPVDDSLIPTGEITSVAGTPFDFRQPKLIGKEIAQAGGFDHCFVLDGTPGEYRQAAEAYSAASGIGMRVHTTQPAMQLYTGNFLDGTVSGRKGRYEAHHAFCLETQGYPDAPNRSEFPSSIVRPGEKYSHKTTFAFFK